MQISNQEIENIRRVHIYSIKNLSQSFNKFLTSNQPFSSSLVSFYDEKYGKLISIQALSIHFQYNPEKIDSDLHLELSTFLAFCANNGISEILT